MHQGTVYYALSGLVAALSIIAAYSAKKAMHRGLSYSAMMSTVWALSFIAIARVIHITREVLDLEATYGAKPEMFEYLFYLIAYVVFVWLIHRTGKTRYTGGEAAK